MSIQLQYEHRDGYLYVRLEGPLSVENVRQAFTQIAEQCKQHGYRRALTDTRALEGNLSTFDVYELGAAIGSMGLTAMERVAVLDYKRPDNQHDFAELVVRNRGVDLRVVTDEDEAIRWLMRDGGEDEAEGEG